MNAKTKAIELDLSDLHNPHADNVLRWQSLWVALVEHPWSTLAVVPVGHESLASDVVHSLVETARAMRQPAFPVTDVVHLVQGTGRRLMSTASPLLFPAAALAARSADAIILVVALQRDTVEQVQRVRDMIGTAHILGCVVARRAPTKDVAHAVLNQRSDGNLQPADGAGAVARGPRPATAVARVV